MESNTCIRYNETNSEAMRYMTSLFGKLKFYQYRQIALHIVENNHLTQLDREEKRTKHYLFKWYSDNFEVIKPMLDNIVLEDEDHNFYGVRRNEMRNN